MNRKNDKQSDAVCEACEILKQTVAPVLWWRGGVPPSVIDESQKAEWDELVRLNCRDFYGAVAIAAILFILEELDRGESPEGIIQRSLPRALPNISGFQMDFIIRQVFRFSTRGRELHGYLRGGARWPEKNLLEKVTKQASLSFG
jgi:hypothetical protein